MFIKLSIVVLLLSIVCGVFGASVAVNDTDAEMLDNGTLLNLTTAVNASENIFEYRQIKLLQLNISEILLDSTENSAYHMNTSLLEERESVEERLNLESSNFSNSGNSSDLEKLSMEIDSTADNSSKADNGTTRDVDGGDSSPNSTQNGTANPWSALPLFRDLNATMHNTSLRNSSDSLNSSQITREIEASENSAETEPDEDSFHETRINNGIDGADQLPDDSNDSIENDGEDDDTLPSKKPCRTVSCLISRGCSDTSCSQHDN